MVMQTLSLFDGSTLVALCSLGAALFFSLTRLLLGLAKSKV